MWRLEKEDGSIFRDGFETQWNALITAQKLDGSSFKKKETLELKSGYEAYKLWGNHNVCAYPYYNQENSYEGDLHKKVYSVKRVKLILIEY